MLTENLSETEKLAAKIRVHSLKMVAQAKSSHIGTCLSTADLLAVLYGEILKVNPDAPNAPERDRFILSKGHGTAILYAVLAEKGFFPVETLDDYCKNESYLTGHANHQVSGVEVSTGSLGHGLPVGCGMALAGKNAAKPFRVFVMLSDGEMDEGSNWESILFAPHHRLDNLIAIIDYNKIQSFGMTKEVLDLEPLADKFKSFGWATKEIDAHNHTEISETLNAVPFETGKPSMIIAHSTKGKGISFMENQLAWHYKSPNEEQLAQALEELKVTN